MTTMVEKVAKALWEVEGVAYGWNDNERRTISWEEASERNLEGARVFRIFARAAIEALMEPTESMLDAGDAADGYDVYVGVWTAMIQAALKETQ